MWKRYGETAPFQYFTSHADPNLIESVRKGRREEFDDFDWRGEPPDPQDELTFLRSKLQWELLQNKEHESLCRLYEDLFRIRRETAALRHLDLDAVEAYADDERRVVVMRRWWETQQVLVAFNFSERSENVSLPCPGAWTPLIESSAEIEESAIALAPYSFGLWQA